MLHEDTIVLAHQCLQNVDKWQATIKHEIGWLRNQPLAASPYYAYTSDWSMRWVFPYSPAKMPQYVIINLMLRMNSMWLHELT